MMINCIAVDDEPFALALVCSYIEQTPFLKLCGKYTSGVEGLKAVHEMPEIQLLFLDIRMTDLSGIELAKIIEQSGRKKNLRIIFTTAYDQYALEGFKVDALDYLLKPFSFVDFSRAATKAYEYFVLLAGTNPPVPAAVWPREKNYLYLKVEYQLVKIDTDEILYIEGLKDYVKLYLKNQDKPLLTLSSLKSLEEKLPPVSFLRIHRSFIVNIERIRSITKNTVQIGQTTISVTEQYRDGFLELLKKWNN